MIQDRTILCVASSRSAERTSKHHVMDALARRNTILWVNYHGTRRPRATGADLRAAGAVLLRAARGPRRISDAMTHFTPLVCPGAHRGALAAANRIAVIAQVRRALKRIGSPPGRPLQIWTFTPDVPFLAGRFGEERFVYYCVDDYARFEGYDTHAVAAAERSMMQRADIVLTSSESLRADKAALHHNVHLVRHGVDAQHFRQALRRDIPIPADARAWNRPVVGFFGLIHHWVDLDLIAHVAASLPAMTFVLIGPVHADVRKLRKRPNVHLLGPRPYQDLPAYCAAFDLAIVPFRQNELTRHVNPIKLREYLAAGLGVVSTPLPETRLYQPDVALADGPAEFAAACAAAVAKRPTHEDRLRRSALVADATWERVVENISPLVMNAPNTPRKPNHPPLSTRTEGRLGTTALCHHRIAR